MSTEPPNARYRPGSSSLASTVPTLLAGVLLATAVGVAQVLVDTVGFTTRDRQVYGPATRFIANDTTHGIHVVWKDTAGFIRYNFRPRGNRWRWRNGRVVNNHPRSLGCLTVNAQTGEATIGVDYRSGGSSHIANLTDSAPGSCRFTETHIASGSENNIVSSTRWGWPRSAATRNDSLFSQSAWSSYYIGKTGPFPGHNLTGSKESGRLCFIWTSALEPDRGTLYIKETPNNGANWFPTVNLSDSVPTARNFSLLGAAAVYDSIRLHLVSALYDGVNRNRSVIWHYSKYDSPPWTPVHTCNLDASVNIGREALAAGRPSVGHRGGTDEYFVAWEQFDHDNVDSRTGMARADIWAARSTDRGLTWGHPVRLTGPDQLSRRFPFLTEAVADTLHISCFGDRIAGFWEHGEGEPTVNPVLHLQVAAELLPAAIQEPTQRRIEPPVFTVFPTISRGGFHIRTAAPTYIEVLASSGQITARKLLPSGRSVLGLDLNPGIYFLKARQSGSRSTVFKTARVVITR